ncbi:unnamed protein product [Rangifer tarandus platyrhynchus]|uniref:Uncharacterized protein n=2 Tax=Rangifer tarandus platyrhynchus TaxID=3082113 RepID=A0ABN8YJ59_RANTA|nr:unnamed protein product [Rangifer tarandus platyrhynchus]
MDELKPGRQEWGMLSIKDGREGFLKRVLFKCLPVDLSGIRGAAGRSPTEENGNPRQYSCLENFMNRGAWRATVQRVSKSQTPLKPLSMHVEELQGRQGVFAFPP